MPSTDSRRDKDLDLARRAAEGDPRAVSELVEAHGAFLVRLAGRICPGQGEDLASELFLVVLEGRGALLRAYRGESSLRAYLGAVARRMASDARRKEARRMLPAPTVEKTDTTGILEALSRLPERDREVLRLRYLEGLPFKALAERLGVPIGTAATWTARARARLKSEFPE